MDEEDMDDKEEQSEESRVVRVGRRRMMTPTQVEREEHERTHVPYGSWCRHCVAARTSIPAHRGGKFTTAVEEDKDMKQMSKDHCFMRDQPEWNQQRFWCPRIAGPVWYQLMWCH